MYVYERRIMVKFYNNVLFYLKKVESWSQIITSAPGLGDQKLTPVKKMLAIMI